METKHTDSPWKVNDIHPYAVYGGEGNLRRQVADCRPVGCVCHTEQDRSNARLIAAAPELLAALQAITEAASNVNVFLDATPPHRTGAIYELRNQIKAARAAIAKAKGGEA
jgi:hypothetical protein